MAAQNTRLLELGEYLSTGKVFGCEQGPKAGREVRERNIKGLQ